MTTGLVAVLLVSAPAVVHAEGGHGHRGDRDRVEQRHEVRGPRDGHRAADRAPSRERGHDGERGRTAGVTRAGTSRLGVATVRSATAATEAAVPPIWKLDPKDRERRNDHQSAESPNTVPPAGDEDAAPDEPTFPPVGEPDPPPAPEPEPSEEQPTRPPQPTDPPTRPDRPSQTPTPNEPSSPTPSTPTTPAPTPSQDQPASEDDEAVAAPVDDGPGPVAPAEAPEPAPDAQDTAAGTVTAPASPESTPAPSAQEAAPTDAPAIRWPDLGMDGPFADYLRDVSEGVGRTIERISPVELEQLQRPLVTMVPLLLLVLGAFLALQRGIGHGLGHVPMAASPFVRDPSRRE